MRTVLVTGGTTRLGRAIADHLRADGWQVFTSSHRPEAGADFLADFTDPAGAVRLYAAVQRRLGGRPPAALVNNAALFAGPAAALEAVNVAAPTKLTTLMACREEGIGSVVNILDCRVLGAGTDAPDETYARTKRDLLAFTRSAAALFAMTLRVNAVAPGPVLAPVAVHERAGETPLGRPSPEEVAAAVSFLLGARATSGCVIPVDGGQSLAASAGPAA